MPFFLSYSFKEVGEDRLDQMRQRMNDFADFKGEALLEEMVRRTLFFSREIAREYPIEVPNSSYKRGHGAWNPRSGKLYGSPRSESLGNSWGTIIFTGGGNLVIGVLFNTASYASYVMGKGTQASIHFGLWNTVEDIVDAVIGLRTDAGTVSLGRIRGKEMEELESKILAFMDKRGLRDR